MKTNQEMVRYIDNFSVIQRTSDGYFDAIGLLHQWNSVEGNPERSMKRFLDSPKTNEFIEALINDESQRSKMQFPDIQAVKSIKSRTLKDGSKTIGQVWMHPLLFIKFAMWINPTFEVKVLRFVYDEMIRYRNDAGDAYKELSSAVMKIVPSHFMPKAMQKIGEALNWIIFNSHEKMLRNKHGDEGKLRELWQLEKKIAGLIEEGFISTYEQLISYLRKLYRKNWEPKVLTV